MISPPINGSLALVPEFPDELDRVASLNLLDEVLTVRRIEVGLFEESVGPRETVAMETFSEAVRRGRELLS